MATSDASGWGTGDFVGSLFDAPEEVHSIDRRTVSVDMAALTQARSLVRQAGIVEMLAQWRAEDGANPLRGGRPHLVTDEQVLTLLMILMLDNSPMHITRARDLVCHRLTKRAQDALGLARDDGDESAWYFRLWRAFRRVLAPIDPYPGQQYHRRYTKDEWQAVVAARKPEITSQRQDRLHRFTNQLVWASVMAMPEKYRDRWDGTIGVDGTALKAAWRGTTSRGSRVSSGLMLAGIAGRETTEGSKARTHSNGRGKPPS